MIPEIVHGHYLKVPVCKTAEYVVYFEEQLNGTVIHCDVFKWNKEVRIKILKTWEVIKGLHGGPIYAIHDPQDLKHEKFLKLFGFTKLKTVFDLNEIWVWNK